MEILWVDDDSPPAPQQIGDAAIVTAQNISSAERLLADKKVRPDWVVVDLIIPQAGWRDHWLMAPGIEFVRQISNEHRNTLNVAVYSIALTDERIRRAREAGAHLVVDKHQASFADLVDQLKTHDLRVDIPVVAE